MKKIVTLSIVFLLGLSAKAQKDDVLLTINNKPVMVSEFKSVYEKNLDLVEGKDAKDIDKNLDLFINYKLKVKQAYDEKLDTLPNYQREYKSYKNQLIAPYLQDKSVQENLIKQAYDRTKEEIKASHILVLFPKKGKVDTLALYNKVLNARKRILNGESFEKVAKEVSEDKSVVRNSGNLGYFSAFRMVYPFEDNAYKTKVGEVSMPFKTRFGYHIVKVTDRRQSQGQFEVAHILATDKYALGKAKIDSAYQALQNGKSFEEVAKRYSQDPGTATKGGKLPKFTMGSFVAPFENAVSSLKQNGTYSKPFQTKYGWHIVKLLNNYPVDSFEKLKPELTKKVRNGDRGKLSYEAVLNKLKRKYQISEKKDILNLFSNRDKTPNDDQLKAIILAVNEQKIPAKDFSKFIKYRKKQPLNSLFNQFRDQAIINYFKDNLENTNPEFKNTLQEYRDGLLLFELLQRKIWNKATNDSINTKKYFDENRTKYKKPFKDIKGKVISDYQQFLEQDWIQQLRKDNIIKLNKRTLRKLKKHYTN